MPTAHPMPIPAPGKKVKKKRKKVQIVANLQHCGYPIIHRAVKDLGWKVAERGESWDFGWSDNNHLLREMSKMFIHPRTLQPVQRVNHLPNNKHLYRKDTLATNMMNLRAEMPDEFRFAPVSWSLPRDRAQMDAALASDSAALAAAACSEPEPEPEQELGRNVGGVVPAGKPKIYIVKPALGLQGIGIELSTEPEQTTMAMENGKGVVQHYVDPPMLIDGMKFDLRLYVFVLSVDPLKIYLYDDGLARLCTTEYQPPTAKNLHKTKMHLTNFSLNKKSKKFVKGSMGSKRSMGGAFDYMAEQGFDVDEIWTNVVDLVVKTVLAVQPQLSAAYKRYVPRNSVLGTPACSVFEILGFDIMMDAGGDPWLIEINHSPSFKASTKQEIACKKAVIQDALEMLGVSEKRKRLLAARVRKQWSAYMWDQARAKSQEKQTATAAVGVAETLAERDRRAWTKGSPAKKKSMPRTPKSKSPDRALPPLNGGDSREDFYPPGARSRLLDNAKAQGNGTSHRGGVDRANRLLGASTSPGGMLRGGSNREQESRLCDDLPVDDSAGCRISGEPARLQGGYLSDEDDLNDGYDENEEAEGLDVEDEGEEVIEDEEDLLMNAGPVVGTGQKQPEQGPEEASDVVSSSSSSSPSSQGSSSESSAASSKSSGSSSSSSGASSVSSVFTASTDSKSTAVDGDAADRDSVASGEAEPDSPTAREDGNGGEAKPTYRYAAPTDGGDHGYIRVYSEMCQNDREKYAGVIAAAARCFANAANQAGAAGDDEEDDEEAAEEEAAAAAEAEEDEEVVDDDASSRPSSKGAAHSIEGWHPGVAQGSRVNPMAKSSGPVGFGARKPSKKKVLAPPVS